MYRRSRVKRNGSYEYSATYASKRLAEILTVQNTLFTNIELFVNSHLRLQQEVFVAHILIIARPLCASRYK